MEKFESEVKALHMALEQVQATLTSPELARLSLKEQLTQRQVIFLPISSVKISLALQIISGTKSYLICEWMIKGDILMFGILV